ncbi:FABP family protein [Kineococcus glutinatus]|uniref:Ferric nitrobindin-like protein n=1 Tax=Kineococcus glutinatus TaxID=1070872 RepID=A0ABP8VHC7_9ACTN
MVLSIDASTPPPLLPLAWLIGRWEGAGVLGHPARGADVRFGQEVEFGHDGRPFLHYTSRTWRLDEDGSVLEPLDVETGYWRPGALDDSGSGPAAVELEVLLAHPTGVVEVYAGTARGPRIDLGTDVVARTATAAEYTAGQRMYGLVDGDLLWALDVAAAGHPMRSYASARLKRVG